MNRADRIAAQVAEALHPLVLRVTDESARHAGHAGASDAGETHYALLIVADGFAGQSRVARSRRVHDILANEFQSGLHALSMTLLTSKEASALGI